MADLIAVTFEAEATAFGLRAALGKLQREHRIDMEDVIVVTRDDQGEVTLHQATSLTAAGALGGSLCGLLIGMTFLDPTLGAAAGAEAETPSRRPSDFGIDDRFMKDLGEGVPEGGSALFVVVRKSTPDKLLAGLDPFRGKGRVLQTSLSQEGERKLRDLLDKGPA